eukprot:253922-Amphidinium_carterae.1
MHSSLECARPSEIPSRLPAKGAKACTNGEGTEYRLMLLNSGMGSLACCWRSKACRRFLRKGAMEAGPAAAVHPKAAACPWIHL